MLSDFKKDLNSIIEKCLKEFNPEKFSEVSVFLSPDMLDVPNEKKHGDYSCNIALRSAKIFKKNPFDVAGSLRDLIDTKINSSPVRKWIKKIEVVKPGFINFYLSTEAVFEILKEILIKGSHFGSAKLSKAVKIQIEFLSANPTGPLSVAHARQAAVGDALGNVLKCAGYEVLKEYYVNDEGNQINILGRSIELRAREILGEAISFPEDGYQGDYIRDMAKMFMEQNHVKNLNDLNSKSQQQFNQFGVDHLMVVIRKELDDFGVHFDVWSYQSKIATVENIESVLKFLRERGFIYDQDGAVWFKSTAFGDDKDRVVKKSDGSFTYLTPDIVYHKNKFERGFQKVVNIWGPDHHGYIPRLKAAVAALGYDPKALEVLIVQLATIFRDGKPLSMSTRKGQYISLREVLCEVGKDAARFFFLMRHINAQLEFDLELAKRETSENPVYYIQYAHARIHSILNVAKQSGLKQMSQGFQLLKEEEEIDLIKTLSHFPDTVQVCAIQLDPFLLTVYLLELATNFHKFYDHHRVIDETNAALSSERLGLIDATRIVLASGLNLLGLNAPQRM